MWSSVWSLSAWCCWVCPFLGWALSDSQAPKALYIEWAAPNLMVFFHTHSPLSSLKATPSIPIPTSWGDILTLPVGKSRLPGGFIVSEASRVWAKTL